MTSEMGTHAETLFVSTADHASIAEAMVELKENVDALLIQARHTAQTAGHFSWTVSSVSHDVCQINVVSKKALFFGSGQEVVARVIASALVVVSWETGLSTFE